MNNIIYLLCVEKERLTGGIHYHPVVDSSDLSEVDLICSTNLIELQNENRSIVNELFNNCETTTIIPIDLPIYQELRDCLKKSIDEAQIALTNAYESLKKAYEILGREIPIEKSLTETTKTLLNKTSSAGKCLDEKLIICDCDPTYKEKYYNDFEEESDYEDID